MEAKKYVCTLEQYNKNCRNRLADGKGCVGYPACSFCIEERVEKSRIFHPKYVRKERWYEKYYKTV